jgi:antitoxin CcdA
MRTYFAHFDQEHTMSTTFDRSAPKRPANLSINSDLLRQAREWNVNLSRLMEQALESHLRELRARQWLTENRGAIADYNAHVEQAGVFSDGLRSF